MTLKRSSAEIGLLKAEMLNRQLKTGDLAKISGIHPKVLTNIITGNNACWPPREAINKALGVEIFAKPTRKTAFRRSLASQVPESKPPTILTEPI